MSEFLLNYKQVEPTTWAYLSGLLIVALYLKFGRLWSLRNLDLIVLILFAPGLLLTTTPGTGQYELFGYVWLLGGGALFLVRLLLDPLMVRRPLLEPNLMVGGLSFLGITLYLFLMANVATQAPDAPPSAGSKPGSYVTTEEAPSGVGQAEPGREAKPSPCYPLLNWMLQPAEAPETVVSGSDSESVEESNQRQAILRGLVIFSQFMIVLGMTVVGYRHFDNVKTGIAAATLYLLLPYTAIFTERLDHALPAALLTWAIVMYRRPIVAGVLFGLAGGLSYFPLFLLPLWISFYWQRGLFRFLGGVIPVLCALVGVLVFQASETAPLWPQIEQMFGLWLPRTDDKMGGFWHSEFSPLDPMFRLPVMAAFAVLCGSLAIWPSQKNLGTLLSCSAAVMLATQFWHPYGGGLYMAWYLPLLLLTVFRPNLEDRVASKMLSPGWFGAGRVDRNGGNGSRAETA